MLVEKLFKKIRAGVEREAKALDETCVLLFLDKIPIAVAVVVCLTLVCAVLAAKFIGCTLPVLAKRLGFDPAVMASPFITTLVDVISLLVYFSIATHVLDL